MLFRRTSAYPISQLILDILRTSGLKKPSAFVRSIGYRNVNGGLRCLDQWLQTGSGDPLFLRRLVMAYGREDEIRDALAQTAEMKKREAQLAAEERERQERARFRPHIYIETTLSRPTSITVAGLFGCRMKVIQVADDLLKLPQQELLVAVQRIVAAHYRANEGQCPLFGAILRYRFLDSFDSGIILNADGKLMAREIGHFTDPLAISVQIGGKALQTSAAGVEIVAVKDSIFARSPSSQ